MAAFSLNRNQSTVCRKAHLLCHYVAKNLYDTLVKFPSGDDLLKSAVKFEQISGLPFAVGAVDGTHTAV